LWGKDIPYKFMMDFLTPVAMKRVIDLFKNKFFLVTVAFAVWMLFFDKNDLYSQYEYKQQLRKLEQERDFYQKETAQVTKDLDELNSNPKKLEKFAREKYLMKRPNEDVFVIVKEKKKDE
jgi:cell division protein FtsB